MKDTIVKCLLSYGINTVDTSPTATLRGDLELTERDICFILLEIGHSTFISDKIVTLQDLYNLPQPLPRA